MQHALADVAERLSTVGRAFQSAAVIAPVAIENVGLLKGSGKIGALQMLATENDPDAELLLEPESCDLIISLLTLHALNDVPGALVQMRRCLRPDGLMLAVFPGGDTLKELRLALSEAEVEIRGGASPRVLPFIDIRIAGALLQRTGFALPVADIETVTVRYAGAVELMNDIRRMGGQNALIARSRAPVSRRFLQRTADIYAEKFSDPDGRVRATFSLVSMSGWVPHESQQKPLAPGSAKVSLAAILEKK